MPDFYVSKSAVTFIAQALKRSQIFCRNGAIKEDTFNNNTNNYFYYT